MIQKIKQCFNNIKYRSKLILLCILVSFPGGQVGVGVWCIGVFGWCGWVPWVLSW